VHALAVPGGAADPRRHRRTTAVAASPRSSCITA